MDFHTFPSIRNGRESDFPPLFYSVSFFSAFASFSSSAPSLLLVPLIALLALVLSIILFLQRCYSRQFLHLFQSVFYVLEAYFISNEFSHIREQLISKLKVKYWFFHQIKNLLVLPIPSLLAADVQNLSLEGSFRNPLRDYI